MNKLLKLLLCSIFIIQAQAMDYGDDDNVVKKISYGERRKILEEQVKRLEELSVEIEKKVKDSLLDSQSKIRQEEKKVLEQIKNLDHLESDHLLKKLLIEERLKVKDFFNGRETVKVNPSGTYPCAENFLSAKFECLTQVQGMIKNHINKVIISYVSDKWCKIVTENNNQFHIVMDQKSFFLKYPTLKKIVKKYLYFMDKDLPSKDELEAMGL